MAEKSPLAFMSYVRLDDEHENGRITAIRQKLSSEVELQTGQEFSIFQDKQDIQWGQNWRQRIEGSIDAVTFFIPIITPAFFNSRPCREELQRFIKREESLGRSDLILPIYYVDCPLLNSPERRAADPLAEAVNAHQYADWRPLRFEPESSPLVRRMVAQVATQLRDSLDQLISVAPLQPIGSRQSSQSRSPTCKRESVADSHLDTESAEHILQGPNPVQDPPTRVVDPWGRGDHSTILEAIQASNSGDRIMVRPGFYEEALVLDKPLEIIGDGEVSEIVVQSTIGNCLSFQASMGRVANLTLRQVGSSVAYCVDIPQGQLVLESCDISSQGVAFIGVHNWADPRLLSNLIHGCNRSGVTFFLNGQGTLEGNQIFGNFRSGVTIHSGASPTLRRNRIYENKQVAIYIHDKGGGTFEDNDLRNNQLGAWDISKDSEPLVRRANNLE